MYKYTTIVYIRLIQWWCAVSPLNGVLVTTLSASGLLAGSAGGGVGGIVLMTLKRVSRAHALTNNHRRNSLEARRGCNMMSLRMDAPLGAQSLHALW